MRDWRQTLRSDWLRTLAVGLILADGVGIYVANLKHNEPVTLDDTLAFAEEQGALAYSEFDHPAESTFERQAAAEPMPPSLGIDANAVRPADFAAVVPEPADSLASAQLTSVGSHAADQLPDVAQGLRSPTRIALLESADRFQSSVAQPRESRTTARHSGEGRAFAQPAVAQRSLKVPLKGVTATRRRAAERPAARVDAGQQRPTSLEFAAAFAPMSTASASASASPAALDEAPAEAELGGQADVLAEYNDPGVTTPPPNEIDAPSMSATVAPVDAVQPATQGSATQAGSIVIPSIAFGQGG